MWNIQNYGAGNVDKWGANSDVRNRLIRDFVRAHNIDVLLIMEMSVNGQPSLSDLRRKLNSAEPLVVDKDWCISYIGSALAAGATIPPEDATDIVYGSDARVEGYAVLWRSNRAAYDMVDALEPVATGTRWEGNNPHPPAHGPLYMSTQGRSSDNVTDHVPIPGSRKRRAVQGYRALTGFHPPTPFPWRADGTAMAYWPRQEMPTTSAGNNHPLAIEGARRPVYLVLNLNLPGGAAARLCPVIVYHAPSNLTRASYGALTAGLARELYVTNSVPAAGVVPSRLVIVAPDRALAGGDYNYAVNAAAWPDEYQYYVRGFHKSWQGGAAMTERPAHTAGDDARRTSVQILQGDHVTPRAGVNSTDYFVYRIDLAFIPSAPALGVTAQRIDMVAELMADAGANYGASLHALHGQLNGVAGHYAAGPPNQRRLTAGGAGPQRWSNSEQVWKPVICGSWGGAITNWTDFMNCLNNGQTAVSATPARRSAELYHIFISDHLPLVFTV
jgi:hypothetical protein